MKTGNGLRYSVPGLAKAQNDINGITVGLINILGKDSLIQEEANLFDFHFYHSPVDILDLPSPFNKPDIVVFHGFYFKKYILIASNLMHKNIPYIITPRSSLTKHAQSQKWLKKKVANFLYFKAFLKHASAVHFLTKSEEDKSKDLYKNKSFVVGNGVKTQEVVKVSNEEVIISFIGRYDLNHKGLDILLDSLYIIRDKLKEKNIRINLYGSDYRGGKEKLETIKKHYELDSIVTINSPVFNKEKETVLLNTDIFIAPSRFEGHPMSVIEAMSYGIPCIITEGTNMKEIVENYNAGWVPLSEPKDISESIINAISDQKVIYEKGVNAKKLVSENYNWEKIALETIKAYENHTI